MSFELDKKVAFLNKLTDETLTMTHYTIWELSSYGDNSLFSIDGPIGLVRAKNLTECIDRAFKLAKLGE